MTRKSIRVSSGQSGQRQPWGFPVALTALLLVIARQAHSGFIHQSGSRRPSSSFSGRYDTADAKSGNQKRCGSSAEVVRWIRPSISPDVHTRRERLEFSTASLRRRPLRYRADGEFDFRDQVQEAVIETLSNVANWGGTAAVKKALKQVLGAQEPNVFLYNSALACLADIGRGRSGRGGRFALAETAEQAERILTLMENSPNPAIQPDEATYTTVIDIWSKTNHADAAQRARAILERMSLPDNIVQPNVWTYSAVLNAYSRSRREDAPRLAEELLLQMENGSMNGEGVRPNVVTYSTVINVHANSGAADAGNRAEAVLNKLITNLQEGWGSPGVVTPGVHCFTAVMKSYIKSKKDVTAKCEELFDRLVEMYRLTGDEKLKPNVYVYNTLIDAYAKQAGACPPAHTPAGKRLRRKAAQRAEAILSRMKTDGYGVQPDRYSFTGIIDAYSKGAGDMTDATKAEELLRHMEDKMGVEPDIPMFNTVLTCWSNVGTVESAEKAELLLERMEKRFSSSSVSKAEARRRGGGLLRSERLTCSSYRAVIHAWMRTAAVSGRSTIVERAKTGLAAKAAERAESILRRLENLYVSSNRDLRFKPNIVTYSSIIDCWAKACGVGGADAKVYSGRARALLDRMEHLYETGVNDAVKPNAVTYTSVLSAYGRAGQAELAEDLLGRIEDMFSSGKNTDLKPNVISYFAVLDGWTRTRSKDSGKRADVLLEQMENRYKAGDHDLKPNARCYGRVVTAYTKSHDIRNAENVLGRLTQMTEIEEDEKSSTHEHVLCWNYVVHAYAKQGNASGAEAVLRKMDEQSASTNVHPDEHTLNSIIFALSICKEEKKAERAHKILKRMEDAQVSDSSWNIRPKTQSYNMVINACSSTRGNGAERTKVLGIAFETYSRLRSSLELQPDRFTYAALLKACGRLLPRNSSERRSLVEQVFCECCCDGLVDDMVLKNFQMAAPPDLSEAVLSEPTTESEHGRKLVIPSQWSYSLETK